MMDVFDIDETMNRLWNIAYTKGYYAGKVDESKDDDMCDYDFSGYPGDQEFINILKPILERA